MLSACALHTHTDSHKSKRKLQVYVHCTVATVHSFIWRIYIKMTLYVIVLSCLHPTPQRPLYIRTGTPCSHFRERCRRRTRRKVSFSLVRGKICAMSVWSERIMETTKVLFVKMVFVYGLVCSLFGLGRLFCTQCFQCILVWYGMNEEQKKRRVGDNSLCIVANSSHKTTLLWLFSLIAFLWHFRSLTHSFTCLPFSQRSACQNRKKCSKLVWKHAHIPIMGNNYFATIILNL